jgi:Flp pilus assembly protein TadD
MAGVLHELENEETGSEASSDAAKRFIVTTYFHQAKALLERGQFTEAENYFREVLRIWPEHASSLNNLGNVLWWQDRLDEAETCYRRARLLAPNEFAILNNLGNMAREKGRLQRAVRWYRRAIKLKADSPDGLMNLGIALSDLGELDEALVHLTESLRLEPASPDCHVNLGMTFARQGRWDEALLCYERALDLRPCFPEARRNRAYIWLARGDYERGWPEYEWRLQCKKLRLLPMKCPRWGGESLPEQSILLHSEQGLGDTLQFIRYVPLVKRRLGRVVVACPEPLIRLLESCPGVDLVVNWKTTLPDSDVHAPIMSLPAILGTTLSSVPAEIPYLSADAMTVADWKQVVAGALPGGTGVTNGEGCGARPYRIGIAWQGNPVNSVDRWRSFPLAHYAHLAELPGVCLISLQKGDGIEQLAALAGRFPVARLCGGEAGEEDDRDFLDTAAVMSELDLVVAPETAVAHLAGAIGVPVWVAVAAVADWRWMIDRDDSPWYPSMRLFRQTTAGDWDGVFRRMALALEHHLSSRCHSLPTRGP